MFKGEETLRKATGVAGEEQAVVLAEGVTVLRNFGSSNALLIEGDGETVLVDALESSGYAEDALPFVQSPVGTLIYTHQHADHIGGAGVLASEAKVIIAHSPSGAKPLGREMCIRDRGRG